MKQEIISNMRVKAGQESDSRLLDKCNTPSQSEGSGYISPTPEALATPLGDHSSIVLSRGQGESRLVRLHFVEAPIGAADG